MKIEEEEKRYYVSMTDRFMSGWGEAKGKIDKLVLSCQSYEEAQIVEANAHNRSEMKYIHICVNKPYYNPRDYSVQYKTIEDCGPWYKKDYFKDRKEEQ